jgi:hypothetical protein
MQPGMVVPGISTRYRVTVRLSTHNLQAENQALSLGNDFGRAEKDRQPKSTGKVIDQRALTGRNPPGPWA